jgi:hypothetical protein
VRRRPPVAACLAAVLLVGAAARADEADRPEILSVVAPARLALGRLVELRVVYRARRANVVAVVQVLEDLDGAHRATRQRELGVVVEAFGREAGDLLVPVEFVTPGRKRVGLTLVTDEREESDPASVELLVVP